MAIITFGFIGIILGFLGGFLLSIDAIGEKRIKKIGRYFENILQLAKNKKVRITYNIFVIISITIILIFILYNGDLEIPFGYIIINGGIHLTPQDI